MTSFEFFYCFDYIILILYFFPFFPFFSLALVLDNYFMQKLNPIVLDQNVYQAILSSPHMGLRATCI